ncbi:hypothetical protein [Flavobacterium sp.]|uniref:hypothetical protein n=1 Tax=Flavobacterium sp. TaxID=239 RepID=UPI0039E68139
MKSIKLFVALFICLISQIIHSKDYKGIRIGTDSIISESQFLSKYESQGYKVIYNKKHCYKKMKNKIYVFEKNISDKDYSKHRLFVVCNVVGKGSLKIITQNKDLIYPENSSMACDPSDAFKKIVLHDYDITIMETSCTKTKGEAVDEYFTFRFEIDKNQYILNEYKIIIRQTTIGDEYPIESLKLPEFNQINTNNYRAGVLDEFRKNFPDYIYQIIK